MRTRSVVRVGLTAFALTVAALSTPTALAQPEGQPGDMGGGEKPAVQDDQKPQRDPAAMKALEDMSRFLREQKHYRVKVESDMGERPDGKGRMTASGTIVFEAPNRVKITSSGGGGGPGDEIGMGTNGTVVSDGKQVMYAATFKKELKHLIDEAPDSLEGIVRGMNFMFTMGMEGSMGLRMPAMIASEEGLSEMTESTSAVKDAGVSTVDGVEVRKIILSVEDEGEAVLLVQTGSKPWPRELSFREHADEGEKGRSMTIKLSDWSDEKPDDAVFAVKAPEGSTLVKTLVDFGGGDDEPAAPEHEAPHEAIGKPAPAFSLPVVGNESTKIDLSSYKDKNIVVIDFWASWCPPCREGLPRVSQVAGDLKDKGVVFLAINVGETPEKAKAFLDKQGYTFTALSDEDSKVSEAYGVNGIPQTVIIDKKGVVRQVHVGFSRGDEKQLDTELKAVLDGKDPRAGDEKKEDAKDEGK